MKNIVFDMDGVLRIGNSPVEGADKIIRYMQKKGIRGMISTNECRYTVAELRDDLSEMGIDIPEDWMIYTAGIAVRDYLEEKLKRWSNRKMIVGVIGERGLYETIQELNKYDNFCLVDQPPDIGCCKDEGEDFKLIIVIGTLNKIKICNLEKGLKWIKAGANVVTTCNDISDPSSKGDYTLGMPNHILHLLKFNANVSKPYSLGKPHPMHAKKIKEYFGVGGDDILFVGDTIYTDTQLAEENGFHSCIVLSGNTKRETLKNYVIEPDYVVGFVEEVIGVLEQKEIGEIKRSLESSKQNQGHNVLG